MRTWGFVLCLAASACGDVKETAGDAATDAATDAPAATHYHYVVDRLNIPANSTEVMQFGLDLDADGDIDNRLGSVITQFRTATSDPAVASQTAVDRGTIITLIDFATTDFTNATGATVAQYTGLQPSPAPCSSGADTVCRGHLMGTGSFTAATMPVNAALVGDVVNGRYLGGPGESELSFTLPAGGITRMHLIGSKVLITTADENRMTLILAGALTTAERDSKVYPAIFNEATAQVAMSCTSTTPPACGCAANSAGQAWIASLDGGDGTPKNCMITASEVANGPLSNLFQPDITIDGTAAISVGFGATAVKATFNPP